MTFSPYQEALLAKRQILINERIDESTEQYVVEAILLLNARNSNSAITLLINSRGGGIHHTKHIVDMIQNSTAPVHGIVIGRAYSSGFNILQACVVRIAYLNADMMCHASDMTGVRVDDKVSLKRTEKETVKVHEEFLKCLSKRSGQSVKRWRKWSLKQEYFTGRQAKKLGIVDKVTRPRKDFPII